MMVSATKSDARIVKTTAIGKLRMNCPGTPGRNRIGRKAKINVAVQPTTETVICSVARTAASLAE